jgi:hypothetical protein
MIAIHQSQFLPWAPYFYKILKSDTFVILDDVQFQKNGVQNRNRIKTPQGAAWLTVPVKAKLGTAINEVEVSNVDVYDNLLKTIELNYKRSLYYYQIYEIVDAVFNKKYKYLNDVNIRLLRNFLKIIGVKTKIIYSSEIATTETKNQLLIEIIKYTGDHEYLSGKGALDYMNFEKFKQEDIKVYSYDFKYIEYPQLWSKQQKFIPDLSVLDLIFNYLEESKNYILNNGDISRLV